MDNQKQLLVPVLAHYFYFPRADRKKVKEVWSHFVGKDIPKEEDIKDFLAQDETSAVGFPCILKALGENTTVCFSLLRNMFIIILLFRSSQGDSKVLSQKWRENLSILEREREQLKEVISFAVGEATVLVGNTSQEGLFLDESKSILPESNLLKTEFSQGNLFLDGVEEGEGRRHYYFYQPFGENYEVRFLVKDLPLMDAVIQKLQRETKFFEEQRHSIMEEKKEIDHSVSSILHQKVVALSKESNKIDLLEEEIGNLSKIYGHLAGDAVIIKHASDILESDLEYLESHLRDLLAKNSDSSALDRQYLNDFRDHLDRFARDEEFLGSSLENVRAALEIVRSRVELERSRESVALQQKGISLQVAAVLVEFVIVVYYSLQSWKVLATPEKFYRIPSFFQGGVVLIFALAVVTCTHFTAKYFQERKFNKGLIFSLLVTLLMIAAMIILPLYFS